MKHRQVDSSLNGELEKPALENVVKSLLHSRGLPQTPEDEVGTQLLGWPLLQVPGFHQPHGLAEACQGAQQRISGTSGGQLVQSAQGE